MHFSYYLNGQTIDASQTSDASQTIDASTFDSNECSWYAPSYATLIVKFYWNLFKLLFPFRRHLGLSILIRIRFSVRVACRTLCYKPEGLDFVTRWGQWFLSVYLLFPAALGPGIYSAYNRNEYQ
jgi:hypothetical protein